MNPLEFTKSVLYMYIACHVLGILIEAGANLAAGKFDRYTGRNTVASVVLMLFGIAGSQLSGAIFFLSPLIFAFETTPLRIDPNWWRFDGSTAWWPWLFLLVADDFIVYWYHRMEHEIRLYWATHRIHHSTTKMNLTAPFRNAWFPNLRYVFWVPLALLGFHPAMIFAVSQFNSLYQTLLHTEVVRKLGPLEKIFVTPSHHRVHHGTQAKYVDKNFGSILIVWDRMFGTFQAEEETPIYGLAGELESDRPLKVYFREWRAIARDFSQRGFSATCRSLLKPPTA